MTTPRSREAGRAAGSAGLFLLLVVVPPILLIHFVGWPLPTTRPDLHLIDQALRAGLDDTVVVKALALIVWMAWAQITLAVLVESIAVIRNQPTPSLPLLPGIQAVAVRLIAGILLLATATNTGAASAASPPTAHAEAAPHPQPSPAAIRESAGAPQPTQPVPPPQVASVTVERHDSLWAIAQRTLGDGLRWRDLRDHNIGRTMPDGSTITADTTVIHPGWILELPVPQSPAAPLPAAALSEVRIERGDSIWSVAEDHLRTLTRPHPSEHDVAAYTQQVVTTNRDRLINPARPDLVYRGQTLVLPTPAEAVPAAPEPGPTHPTTPTEPEPHPTPPTTAASPSHPLATPPVTQAPPPAAGIEPAPRSDTHSKDTDLIFAIGGLTSIALAAGAKRVIARRRRRVPDDHQGHPARPTPTDVEPLHRQLVAVADEDRIDALRNALTDLAKQLATRHRAERPLIVQHDRGHLDVLLDHPSTEPPPGWSASVDGHVWTHTEPAPPSEECATPLLVTLGAPDDDGQLYLDLTAAHTVALVGDADVVRDAARSILTEAVLSPLAESVRVIVVGDLLDAASATLDRVHGVDTWHDVENEVLAWAEQSHRALIDEGWPNPFVAHGADPDHEALSPLLVIATKPPHESLSDALEVVQPSSVAVVVADTFDVARLEIECQPDRLTVTQLGLSCTPKPLDLDTLASLVRLLDIANEPSDGPNDWTTDALAVVDSDSLGQSDDPEEEATPPVTVTPAREPSVAPEHLGEPDHDVVVRLLGDIRIDGARPIRAKATAVAAYIALHRSVSVEALEDACWADHGNPTLRRLLRDVLSECRAGIGADHLPASVGGRYTMGPRVVTDTQLFDLRIDRARLQSAHQAVETYRQALELVTGKVFSYPSRSGASFGWIDTENLVSQWEVKIAQVAQHCSELLIDLRRPDDAVEVALDSLRALPLHTTLTETLMRAHAARSDAASVDAVYRAHLEGLARVHGDEPAETTTLLHRQLRRIRDESGHFQDDE